MENRLKPFKTFTFVLGAFLFLLPYFCLAYNSQTTHPALTQAASEYYNQRYKNPLLSLKEIEWLKNGSKDEDLGYRWLNHAYDPIYQRGWFKDIQGVKIGLTSKKWANDKANQLLLGSHNFIANPKDWLAGLTRALNQSDNNQTWEKAIYEYIKGNRQAAFYALGHILHLIEDAYVPAHTRQNPHIGFLPNAGSVYEDYTSRFKEGEIKISANQLDGFIFKINSLDEAFDLAASYTNKYFYSEDTIRSLDYNSPQPLFDRYEGVYLLGEDEDKSLFRLARRTGLVFRLLSGPDIYTLDDPLVLQDYWERLSPRAIAMASQVINLFFKEANRLKNDKAFLSRNSQNLLADISKVVNGWFQNLTQNQSDYIIVATNSEEQTTSKNNNLSLSNSNNSSSPTNNSSDSPHSISTQMAAPSTNKSPSSSQNNSKTSNSSNSKASSSLATQNKSTAETTTKSNTSLKTQTETAKNQNESPKENLTAKTASLCSFNQTTRFYSSPIIINEVAWMGNTKSSSDEWIELKNITNQSVDISGWQILSQEENIKIIFDQAIIPASGYYLLERTDDNTVVSVPADKIYTGSLNNSDDGLRLFNEKCEIMDEVFANPDWPAGDKNEKRTMERDFNYLSWHISSTINGTPKANNSPPYIPPEPETPINNSQNQTNNNSANNSSTNNSNSETSTSTQETSTSTDSSLPSLNICSQNNLINPSLQGIIINEVAWMGSKASYNKEWIELKNISESEVDIKNWQLLDKDEQIKIIFGQSGEDTKIPAGGFYLLERTSDDSVANIPADLIYTGSLANTDEALRLFDDECQLVDEALADQGEEHNWPAGDNISKRTMERSEDFSWHTYSGEGKNNIFGTPKAENSLALDLNEEDNNQIAETSTVTLPQTYVKNFTWRHLSSEDPKLIMEFDTDGYPFIPPIANYSNTWTAMIFYLNQEVPDEIWLAGGWEMPLTNENNQGLVLEYDSCSGYRVQIAGLILPVPNDDPPGRWCSSAPGAPRSFAYRRDLIPLDNHFVLNINGIYDKNGKRSVLPSQFKSSDFLTIGFYAFAGSNYLKLVQKDNHHYYFDESYKPPRPSGIGDFIVSGGEKEEEENKLIFSWSPPEGLDQLTIRYEIYYQKQDSSDNGLITININQAQPISGKYHFVLDPPSLAGYSSDSCYTFKIRVIDKWGFSSYYSSVKNFCFGG